MNRITISEVKDAKKKAIVIACLNQVMKNVAEPMQAPVPSGTNVFSDKPVPAELADLIRAEKQALSEYENGREFPPEHDAAMLLYDAWLHRDVDWNDCYTYRMKTEFGVKTLTYVNAHPTAEQLETMRMGFADFYLEEIAEGYSDEHICNMIAGEVADYCLGEDYTAFFNEELERLPDDMRTAFLADAKRLLAELKQK